MIKIDVFTGFLGAGKTTFLQKMIEYNVFANEKIIIIENEFGELPIDTIILENDNYILVELKKGCICCSLKGELINTLVEIEKQQKPDRIVIEPSGIFVIEDLFTILDDKLIKDKFVLNKIITIIDIKHFQLEKMRYATFFYSQLKYADHMILSKHDGYDQKEIIQVIEECHMINKKAIIHTVSLCDWDYESLYAIVDANNRFPERLFVSTNSQISNFESHQTKHLIDSIAFDQVKAFNTIKFNKIMHDIRLNKWGNVLRMKGFIYLEDGLILINYVQGILETQEAPINANVSLTIIGERLDKTKLSLIFET